MNETIESTQKDSATEPTRKPAWLWIVSACLIVLGITVFLLGFLRDYTLVIDDQTYSLKTIAFRTGTVLKRAGLEVNDADQVSADLNKISFKLPDTIILNRARPVTMIYGSKIQQLNTAERYPATLLDLAGISFFPNDLILQNELPIDPHQALPLGRALMLEYIPAKLVQITDNGHQYYFSTQKENLAEALAEQNIQIGSYDRLSVSLDTALSAENDLEIRRARQFTAMLGNQTFSGFSAASDPEEALLDIGLAIQNLDQVSTESALDDHNRSQEIILHIDRVTESYELVKEETPFKNTYELDPNAQLDTTTVLVPGQMGYVVTRSITQYRNGEPVKTLPSQHWKASDPVDGVLGQGTLAVVNTETVDGVTLEYWRKVSVYATSYKPSSFPPGERTRSGAPIEKGIVAVSAAWYPSMAGQPVYVPGYGFGVIGDSGYGIPGRYWIDLAYDDASYVGWHHWTTLYFLTPIPAYIPAILP